MVDAVGGDSGSEGGQVIGGEAQVAVQDFAPRGGNGGGAPAGAEQAARDGGGGIGVPARADAEFESAGEVLGAGGVGGGDGPPEPVSRDLRKSTVRVRRPRRPAARAAAHAPAHRR